MPSAPKTVAPKAQIKFKKNDNLNEFDNLFEDKEQKMVDFKRKQESLMR